jgi:hypothetical protein
LRMVVKSFHVLIGGNGEAGPEYQVKSILDIKRTSYLDRVMEKP